MLTRGNERPRPGHGWWGSGGRDGQTPRPRHRRRLLRKAHSTEWRRPPCRGGPHAPYHVPALRRTSAARPGISLLPKTRCRGFCPLPAPPALTLGRMCAFTLPALMLRAGADGVLSALQEPEARSDLGPTTPFGPRLGGASVTTGLGGASVRGSTEPRWRFGEIKNGWIWCNLAHIWWIHEACGGGCGRGRWDPPDQREIRRDPAVFKQIQQFCVLNGLI